MTSEIIHKAPDGTKALILRYVGEVRFGPEYFEARPQGFPSNLRNLHVGEQVVWSPDSKLIAVAIFNTTDSAKQPDIDIAVINTDTGEMVRIDKIRVGLFRFIGFTSPDRFEYEIFDREANSFLRRSTNIWDTR